MSIRYWIAASALGLTLATNAALGQDEPPEQPIDEPAAQEQSAEQPAVEPQPPVRLPPAEPASPEHDEPATENAPEDAGESGNLILGDGWAQWIMAGTGIAAFFLSAWAVWLLYLTLQATRKAVAQAESGTQAAKDTVAATRRIGEAQVRAYLSIERVVLKVGDDLGVGLKLDIRNSGLSPAFNIYFSAEVSISMENELRVRTQVWPVPDMAPNATFTTRNISVPEQKLPLGEEFLVSVSVAIIGEDVFGNEVCASIADLRAGDGVSVNDEIELFGVNSLLHGSLAEQQLKVHRERVRNMIQQIKEDDGAA